MVRVKVWQGCSSGYFSFGIYEGKKKLMFNNSCSNDGSNYWYQKSAAIRNAKAMAKRIRIKFDPEIIKQHGC